MYANGGAADANSGRKRKTANDFGGGGGGGGGDWSGGGGFEGEWNNFGYDNDHGGGFGAGAGVDAEYAFFSHQRRGRRKSHREADADTTIGVMRVKGGAPAAQHRYVDLNRVARKQRKRKVKSSILERNKSMLVAEAIAEGDDERARAAAIAAIDSSMSSNDDAELKKALENVPDDARKDAALTKLDVHTELTAARVNEDAMYISSCSEDEEVLQHTLRMLRFEHIPHHAQTAFEDDNEKDAPTMRVPEAIGNLFDEVTRSDIHSGVPESVSHAGGHSQDDSDDDDDDDEFGAHAQETRDSHAARVHKLRSQIKDVLRQRGNPPSECFKCMWGNAQYDAVNAKPLYQLFQLMEREVGRRDLRAVAKLVHKFFKHAIFLPMTRAGKRIHMWRTRDVYVHLTEHDCDPRIQMYRMLRELNQLGTVLMNETHTFDPETRAVIPHPQVVRSALDTYKLRLQIMSADPKKMLFHDEHAAFDLSSAAANPRAGGGSSKPSIMSGNYTMELVAAPRAVQVRNK